MLEPKAKGMVACPYDGDACEVLSAEFQVWADAIKKLADTQSSVIFKEPGNGWAAENCSRQLECARYKRWVNIVNGLKQNAK